MAADGFALPFGFRDATGAAAAVARGEVSSSELVDATLARIDDLNTDLNAVVVTAADRAREQARRVDDARAAGAGLGRLAGVPITVKEAFQTVGLATTWGLPSDAGWTADEDAVVVRRLREAGAIVVGKTNVATMLADFAQTTNEVYGRTNNPHDPTRSPGGSSGGSAAAVAAGLSFLDYGSDLAGSIRIPAAFCGVYGLRPTENTVSQTGFAPPGAPAAAQPAEVGWISTVGPIARTVTDIRTALSITADRTAHPPARRGSSDRPRIGVVLDDAACPLAGDVGAVLSDTLDTLAAAGVEVLAGWPSGVDSSATMSSFGFALQRFMASADPASDWSTSDDEISRERRRLDDLRRAWADYFAEVDVFVCPVNFTAAIEHDDRPFELRTVRTVDGERRYDEQPFWTAQPAVAGLPALAAPVGRTGSGLPVAVQIVGPAHGEGQVLDAAERFAELLGSPS